MDEVEAFTALSSALLVNMGTLSSEWVAAKKLAAKQAVALGKPWVLDPDGCGATSYRTRACLDMLHCRPTVVRGNGSEIMALSGAAGRAIGEATSTFWMKSIYLRGHRLTLPTLASCPQAVSKALTAPPAAPMPSGMPCSWLATTAALWRSAGPWIM